MAIVLVADGTFVGLSVGTAVGNTLGAVVGVIIVGKLVGNDVGWIVGIFVDVSVGSLYNYQLDNKYQYYHCILHYIFHNNEYWVKYMIVMFDNQYYITK